jgi:ABC-2 type transport system permease protein
VSAFLRRYVALTLKEIQQLRRNRGLLVQLLIPPTVVLIIFGFALNPEVRDLRMGIVDQSFTPESRAFVNSLTQNLSFDVTHQFLRASDAEAAMNNMKIDMFIVLPPDFASNLLRQHPSDVQVVLDAVDANTANIAQGYLQQGMMRALTQYNSWNGLDPTTPTGAVRVSATVLYNPGLVTPWFYVTGIMSILIFINGSLVASALAVKEKETGTIEQLLMTPAQTAEMLLAKTTPVFVLLMIVLLLALAVSMLVFGLPFRGSFLLFLISGMFASLAGIGIGVTLATVSSSQQQAQLLTFFVNPPLTLISGASSPIENMPQFFQKLSYFDPLRYLVTIIRGVTIKNAPFSALWPNLAALAAFSIILFAISAWRFRKQ